MHNQTPRTDSILGSMLYACGAITLSLMMTIAGCGRRPATAKLPVFAVSGSVLIDGEPAVGARVIFLPENDASFKSLAIDAPRALVDAQGRFQLTTFNPNDGAPEGRYGVMIDMRPVQEGFRQAEDPLAGRYLDPKKSGLMAEVKAPGTQLEPFQLTSK